MANSIANTDTSPDTQKTNTFKHCDNIDIRPILTNRVLTFIAALSFFGIFSHWNFFEIGQYNAGWNTSVFYLSILLLLYRKNTALKLQKDWYWLAPLFTVAISFAIFENPWLKLVSLLLMPIGIAVFYHSAKASNQHEILWGRQTLAYSIKQIFKVFALFGSSKNFWIKQVSSSDSNNYKQIVKGIALLIPVGIFVTILLSSADENFEALVGPAFDYLIGMNSVSALFKVLFSIGLGIYLLALAYSWRLPSTFKFENKRKPTEDIVYGILMSGILVLYSVFLFLQFEYLVVNTLPTDFGQTEHIVKSGFWQLFVLSIINVLLFVNIYRRTSAIVQHILRVYIVASGLLLLSACWRIFLYVKLYGLSYEKYFASYTCLFAVLTFAYLIWATFSTKRADIVRFLAFSMLWAFAVSTVTPVEKIIYNTNYALAHNTPSRVDLGELRSLSADVLGTVKTDLANQDIEQDQWQAWVNAVEKRDCDSRKWYETNMSLLINCHP